MIYSFGDYEFDIDRRELRCAGAPLRIEPKVFELLACLLQHRGQFVTREELYEQVWPEQFVSDAALSYSIARARQAIGDTGRAQRIIKTVYGRGYCFIAPVQEILPRSTLASHAPPEEFTEVVAVPPPAAQGNTAESPSPGPLLPADTLQQNIPIAHRDVPLPSLAAEHRQLTVLWCRIAPSTADARLLDPEAFYQVMQEAYNLCGEVIQRFAGWMAQRFSNGYAVYFGYPQAHEDDARRAVWAALEMVDGMQRLAHGRRGARAMEYAVRIGIHTGMVVMEAVSAEVEGHLLPGEKSVSN